MIQRFVRPGVVVRRTGPRLDRGAAGPERRSVHGARRRSVGAATPEPGLDDVSHRDRPAGRTAHRQDRRRCLRAGRGARLNADLLRWDGGSRVNFELKTLWRDGTPISTAAHGGGARGGGRSPRAALARRARILVDRATFKITVRAPRHLAPPKGGAQVAQLRTRHRATLRCASLQGCAPAPQNSPDGACIGVADTCGAIMLRTARPKRRRARRSAACASPGCGRSRPPARRSRSRCGAVA
jgi:hypothetical protein